MIRLPVLFLCAFVGLTGVAFGQTSSELFAITPADPLLETAAPTLGPVAVPFQNNSGNPANNAIGTMPAPVPAVSLSIVNAQHFTGADFAANGLSIGGHLSGRNRFEPMNVVGGGRNNQFTALPVNTAGSGIRVSTNQALHLENATSGLALAGLAGSGRYHVADLVIDFSVPIQDPVLHVSGLGEVYGGKNFTTEFTHVPGASIGVTGISRLSGNFRLVRTGNDVSHGGTGTNITATCGNATSGAAAACGSILFDGESVSRIHLQVFLRSTQATAWPMAGADMFLIGVSGEFSDMRASVSLPSAMTPSITPGTAYTGLSVTCVNQGPNTARGVACQPRVSAGTVSGLTCSPALPAIRTPGQSVTCGFSYLFDGPAPLPTTVTFEGQTWSNSDLNGAQDPMAGNNLSAALSRPAITPAHVEAVKAVSVFSQDGAGCAEIPGSAGPAGAAALPGACLEYVISLTNRGSIDATDISMTDTLGPEVTFMAASRSGFDESAPAFAFSVPAAGTDCGGGCVIGLTDARLAMDQTGTIRVRVLLTSSPP